MVFILSRMVELVFIYFLWKIVFLFKKISKKTLWIFGVIFFVYLAIGFFNYPQTIASMEIDNFGNYSRAIRFLPAYWQSCLYRCFLRWKHDGYSICVRNFLFSMSDVCIRYWLRFWKNRDLFSETEAKYLLLFLFLLPESYFLAFNAYRNDIYTSLCFACLAFGYLKYLRGEREKLNLMSELGFILLTLDYWYENGSI